MEYDFADKLDLEWHSIFQRHLRYFSYQNKSKTYSFEDILKEVFCPDPDNDQDVKNEDKEIIEKCLLEALSLLSSRQSFPRQSQIRHLLNIAKYATKDESSFINLNASNVFASLIYLSQPSTEESTRISFMEFLGSFLEHSSGVKWLMETKYYTEVFASIVNYQDKEDQISKMGNELLRILLEKTIEIDENYSKEIMAMLTNPLLHTAQRIKLMKPVYYDGLKPSLRCLVEILEGLLKNYSANALQYIANVQVGVNCDLISEKSLDVDICLLLDRISIILSLFGFIDIFDGIKTIKQDPLELSGLIKVFEREADKGLLTVVFDLLHYAVKYIRYISEMLPKYFEGDKQIDTEGQLVSLQLTPTSLEWTRLDCATDLKEEPDANGTPMSHPLKIFKSLSARALHIGFKIKDKIPTRSYDLYTRAIENIMRTKEFYSKKSLCDILNTLVYALEAPLRYFQSKKNEKVIIKDAQQIYIFALLEATLSFIGSFNLDWPDSVKVLDLLYIVIEGCSAYEWIEPIIMDSLILLQEIITRRYSPSMALLIDTPDGFKNIGPLLNKTCFTNNWKIRNGVLEVVYTIALSANNGFSSFKTILFEASLPSLASIMALNDKSLPVRATALKCLQEMVKIEDTEEILQKNILTNKVLDIIMINMDVEVTIEAIKLIAIIYNDEKYLDQDVMKKTYKCLEHVAFSNGYNDNIQKEVVEFWRIVIRKFLTDKGWVNTLLKFPDITFSKRIIPLTKEEVNKRCYKALSGLSRIGCLDVFKKYFESYNQYVDAKKGLMETLDRFHYVFSSHKITQESMLFNEEFMDLSSIQLDSLISPEETEDILQEIVSERMMEMMPVKEELINNKDLFSLMETSYLNISAPIPTADSTSENIMRITPSEFVGLVYRKISELSPNGEVMPKCQPKETEVYIIDYKN